MSDVEREVEELLRNDPGFAMAFLDSAEHRCDCWACWERRLIFGDPSAARPRHARDFNERHGLRTDCA